MSLYEVLNESMEKKSLVEATLKECFPHGHPGFIPMLLKQMDLHSRKNYDYAKGGNPLGNFDRVSKLLALYPGLDLADPCVVALVYALKQLDAYAWMKCQKYDGAVEGKDDRLADVQTYVGLIRLLEKEKVT